MSESPWQAGFGLCQNLELWQSTVALPVRPASGLPAVQISLPASCGFSCCCFPHLTPRTEWQEAPPQSRPLWEKDGPEHGFLELHQSSGPRGARKPRRRRLWRWDPSAGRAVGNTLQCGGTWPDSGETGPGAAWEATAPDSSKHAGCRSETKQLSGWKRSERTWLIRFFFFFFLHCKPQSLYCAAVTDREQGSD